MAERVLCVIGARSGSKGVPSKNTRLLLGKPLIVWSIEQALACTSIDRVVVSTDSQSIADVATKAGAEVPFMRPAELANDYAGKFQVWQHALPACEAGFNESYDVFVDLDCTNPLRDVEDITAAIEQFRPGRGRGVDAVISVCEARKNPYFTLFEADEQGWFRMSKTTGKMVLRRQDQPDVYEHVASIYVLHPAYLRTATHLLDGRAEGYDIGQSKSFDLDSELDFLVPLRDRCSFGRFQWLISQALSVTYMAGERRLCLERNCRLPESPAHSRRRNREGPASSKGLNSQQGSAQR